MKYNSFCMVHKLILKANREKLPKFVLQKIILLEYLYKFSSFETKDISLNLYIMYIYQKNITTVERK